MSKAERHVKSASREAADNPVLRIGARAGYAAVGVMHLLLAWLAFQLAWLDPGSTPDQSGAVELLLTHPVGLALALICLAGFALLALWQLVTAVVEREWSDRVKPIGLAVAYAALASVVARTLLNHRTSSTQQTATTTGTLMSHPAGVAVVGLIGAAIAVAGGWHIYSGLTARFRQQLRRHPPAAVEWCGRIGYVLKGLAFLAMGVLFIVAAIRHDASQSNGLDGALRNLLALPFGPLLVSAIAVGLAAYGIYSFARARYGRV